jgi:hypothetical protein
MDLHNIVAPSWEVCFHNLNDSTRLPKSFAIMQVCADSLGAVLSSSENSLDYKEFRQISRILPVRPGLSSAQVVTVLFTSSPF